MKRSEAINLIVELLPEIEHVNTTKEILADVILTALENKGMLPPEIEIEIKAKACTWWYRGNDWEHEE